MQIEENRDRSDRNAHADERSLAHDNLPSGRDARHIEPSIVENLEGLSTGIAFERIVTVTNRQLFEPTAEGGYTRTPGGLATAVHPVLAGSPGSTAISWDVPSKGAISLAEFNDRIAKQEFADRPFDARGVALTKEEVKAYYEGYANGVLWPALHGLLARLGEIKPSDWSAYRGVNEKFAAEAVRVEGGDGLIWIHDYHLMLAPAMIRESRPQAHVGYFHHIPFAGPEILRQALGAEQHEELLRGLLGNDLIGFHTAGYGRSFMDNVKAAGIAEHVDYSRGVVSYQGRNVQVGVFPISIDVPGVEKLSRGPGAQAAYEDLIGRYGDKPIFFGVDRLDYTKGIEERLAAVGKMLEADPDLAGKFRMIQYVAPSRTGVPEYQELRKRVVEIVERVNSAHATENWRPIEYVEQNLAFETVLGYCRAADVVVITPLVDGMNLVIKEAVVSGEGRTAYILGKGAGAAEELVEALQVDGSDPSSIASAMRQALELHSSSPERVREDWRKLYDRIAAYPIDVWRTDFLTAARAAATNRTQNLVQ